MRDLPRAAFAALFAALATCTVGCSSNGSATNPPAGGIAISKTVTSGITANASLYEAVDGPDGRIWFTEFQGDNLAAVTTHGTVSEYPMGASTQPCGVAVGPDGNIWTGGFGSSIERVSTSGSLINTYSIAGAHICSIVSGPGGLLWFADYGNDKVGTISTGGTIVEHSLPAGASPSALAVGSDGNVWIADSGNNVIDKISPAGTVLATYSSGISAGEHPNAIIAAPDNNLYVTEDAFSATVSDKIARVTTGGTITEIGTLPPSTYPDELAVGKDGNVYFTEYNGTKIGKITLPSALVSTFAPGIATNGSGIAAGPDQRLWVGTRQTIYALTY